MNKGNGQKRNVNSRFKKCKSLESFRAPLIWHRSDCWYLYDRQFQRVVQVQFNSCQSDFCNHQLHTHIIVRISPENKSITSINDIAHCNHNHYSLPLLLRKRSMGKAKRDVIDFARRHSQKCKRQQFAGVAGVLKSMWKNRIPSPPPLS